jgi:branched-chain amino acid transport system substrate-binding protein
MTRVRRAWPLAIALLFLAAACGQKAGIGSLVASGNTAVQGSTEESGVSTSTTGETGTTSGSTPTGATTTGATTGGTGGKTTGTPGATTSGGGGKTTGGTAAATGPADRTGITATTIKIGIHFPKTGAAPCTSCDQAVGVYSQYAGQIKGLGNRRIEIIARDDKFDAATARTVCKELVEKEHVFMLIGGAGVDAIKSCAEYAQSAGVPYLSPGVTEGPFRSLSNYFAISETYNQQNVQLAQLIKHQIKKTKVGIVLTDSPLLNETDASFRAEAKRNGLTVVGKTQRLAHDAGKTQTDTVVSNLKRDKAEVVYALISPIVFGFLVSSAKQQSYYPVFTGPGLSNGVNLVGSAVCPPPPFPDVRFFSPMVQLDVIDKYDPAYKPAYRKKNGSGRQPDDIGILLWGIEKTARLMMEAAGPNLSRQSLIKTLTSGKPFATNVYAPVKYGGTPHFGANAITLLTLDCSKLAYQTTKAFATGF